MVDEVKEITKPEDCPKWDTCSAPIEVAKNSSDSFDTNKNFTG